jgi:hypothetical protein
MTRSSYSYVYASSLAAMRPLPLVMRDIPDGRTSVVMDVPQTGRDPLNAIDLRTPSKSSAGHEPIGFATKPATPCQSFEPRKSERLLAKAKLGRDSSRANVLEKACSTFGDAGSARSFGQRRFQPLEAPPIRSDLVLSGTRLCDEPPMQPNQPGHATARTGRTASFPMNPAINMNIDNPSTTDPHTSMTNLATCNNRPALPPAAPHSIALNPPHSNAYPAHMYYYPPPQHTLPAPYGIDNSINQIQPYGLYYFHSMGRSYLPVTNPANTRVNTMAQDGRILPTNDVAQSGLP